MRTTLFVLLVTFSQLFASGTYSQNVRLSLDLRKTSIKDVLLEIENNSEFFFMYDATKIDVLQEIDVVCNNQLITEILDEVFLGTNIVYEINNRQIALNDHSYVNSQDIKTISGQVTDQSGSPLPGVTVVVKGTTQGTITDSDGNYSLTNVPSDGILVFSFVGMKTEEIPVTGKTTISITLAEETIGLEEVVAVGYGTMKKVNLTGAVSNIRNDKLENKAVTNLSQALSGQMPGVTITQSSGEPGEDAGSILIRGAGTFSSAGIRPLIIVDGLPGSLNQIDPNTIESISVLKDAASAAIYGARAANGVILVTTKRGEKGELVVSYNGYAGWQRPTTFPKLVDSWTYAELYNEALTNMGQQPQYSNEVIQQMKNGVAPYVNEDHYHQLFYSGTGFQTGHNLNFNGGSESTQYAVSLSYLKHNGLVVENYLDRYNLQFNLDQRVRKNMTLKTSILAVHNKFHEPIASAGSASRYIGRGTDVRELFKAALFLFPYIPAKYPDGSYGRYYYYSAQGWIDSDSFGENTDRTLNGNIGLNWEILDGLTVSGTAGYNYNNGREKYFNAVFQMAPDVIDSPSKLREYYTGSETITLQSIVEYNKEIGGHEVNLLAGWSQESNQYESFYAYREDFPDNDLNVLTAGSSSKMENDGNLTEWAIRSYFGRARYAYKDRYLFEANARYDGSSRFRKGVRYGFFPSFSGGWIMSNESFFNIPWISNLKLRGSWGELGNQNISKYPYQATLGLGYDYLFGEQIQSGITMSSLANRDISWETTRIIDMGVDASLFNNKLSLTVDYFNKKTNDILYQIDAAMVLGLSVSESNAGEVLNRGWEFILNHKNSLGEFSYNVSANFSTLHNEVLKLANVDKVISFNTNDYYTVMEVGQPINAFYGFVSDGLFVDQADIDSYPTQNRTVQPGDVRNKDISGPDGVPDGKVDATYDRTVIGSQIPKYTFGLNLNSAYKGFDFSVLLQGHAGVEGLMRRWAGKPFYAKNLYEWMTDRWTPENPDRWAKVPRYTTDDTNFLHAQGFWVLDASYIRVKDIQIGYTFPKTITDKLKISSLRIYASGRNLWTFDSYYDGFDPEATLEEDQKYYPPTGIYSFGINLKL